MSLFVFHVDLFGFLVADLFSVDDMWNLWICLIQAKVVLFALLSCFLGHFCCLLELTQMP